MTHAYNEFESDVFACDNCSETITGNVYSRRGKKFKDNNTARKAEFHSCADCANVKEQADICANCKNESSIESKYRKCFFCKTELCEFCSRTKQGMNCYMCYDCYKEVE